MSLNEKLYYHRLGETQDKDVLVFEMPEYPTWSLYNSLLSDCGKYLILSINKDLRGNRVYISDLEKSDEINGKVNIKPIVSNFEADYEVSEISL